MIHYAMNYGAVVGMYYIAKFCLFPMSLHSTFAGLLFFGLTLMVPLLVFRLTRLYRDRYVGSKMTFTHALAFAMLTMGFGSLLASVAHYVYFAFIDGGAMTGALERSIEDLAPLLSASVVSSDTAVVDSIVVAAPVLHDSVAQTAVNAADENIALNVSLNEYITMLRSTVEQIRSMSPIEMTMGMLSNNLSWSVIVALPVAAFVTMRRIK